MQMVLVTLIELEATLELEAGEGGVFLGEEHDGESFLLPTGERLVDVVGELLPEKSQLSGESLPFGAQRDIQPEPDLLLQIGIADLEDLCRDVETIGKKLLGGGQADRAGRGGRHRERGIEPPDQAGGRAETFVGPAGLIHGVGILALEPCSELPRERPGLDFLKSKECKLRRLRGRDEGLGADRLEVVDEGAPTEPLRRPRRLWTSSKRASKSSLK